MTAREQDDRRAAGAPARARGSSATGSRGSTPRPSAAEPAAYVFVMGSLAELLRVFDLHARLPRDQLAADRGAARGARVPERGRGLRLLARHLRLRQGRRRHAAPGRGAPDGPHPEAGARGRHQRLQHLHQVGGDLGALCTRFPMFTLDVPGSRSADGRRRRRAARTSSATAATSSTQIRELIALCEQVTGKRFDIDRLREVLRHANA